MDGLAILFLGIVAVRYIYDIVVDILLYDIPWTAAQTETFALPYRVEPVSTMHTEFTARLDLDYRTGLFPEMTADEVVVIDFSEKTDALRIFSSRIWQICGQSHFSDRRLRQITYREHKMA